MINKYTITTLAFVVWMVFFDSNNFLLQMKYRDKLKDLQREKQFYMDEIRHDSLLTRKLLSDSSEIEKFAREKYLMKKDNEDVFLIQDTTAGQRQ